jgi:hypothetical protein
LPRFAEETKTPLGLGEETASVLNLETARAVDEGVAELSGVLAAGS